MTDVFTQTKLDLIKTSLSKLETAVTELRKQLDEVEYELQQEDYSKLESELAFNAMFKDSIEALERLGA